jgi:hypothetical protein
MSKLRKWLMKDERVGSPISSVDPAIKLFGRTIAVNGGSTDAENGEVISDSPSPRQKAPLPCSQVGSLFFFPFLLRLHFHYLWLPSAWSTVVYRNKMRNTHTQ